MRAALGDHPNVGDIRGEGMLCAVEFVRDRTDRVFFEASDQDGPRMNILFIMYDQLRFDYLSCAGHPHLHTPNFDRVAAFGLRRDVTVWRPKPIRQPSVIVAGLSPDRQLEAVCFQMVDRQTWCAIHNVHGRFEIGIGRASPL